MPEKSRWLLLRVPEEDWDSHCYVGALELTEHLRETYERRSRATVRASRGSENLRYLTFGSPLEVKKIEYENDPARAIYESLYGPGFLIVDEMPEALTNSSRLDSAYQVITTYRPSASYWSVSLKHENHLRATCRVDFSALYPNSPAANENPRWLDDELQFARLISEIVATADVDLLTPLSGSMDLSLDELSELFDRAHSVWEKAKMQAHVPDREAP